MNTIMLKINLKFKLHYANDNIISIAHSKVQIRTKDESITRKITSKFIKFEVLSLECHQIWGMTSQNKRHCFVWNLGD